MCVCVSICMHEGAMVFSSSKCVCMCECVCVCVWYGDGLHLYRVLGTQTSGLAALVTHSELACLLQLSLQTDAGLISLLHLLLALSAQALYLLPQVALGLRGLSQLLLLRHTQELQLLEGRDVSQQENQH